MKQSAPAIACFGFLAIVSATPIYSVEAAASSADFNGDWRTSIGAVKLKQTGGEVTGSYGDFGQFSLKGKVEGDKLSFEFQEGTSRGDAVWLMDEAGFSFRGDFKIRDGQSGVWLGWRPDPNALKGEPTKLGGLWLTSNGLMELEQTAEKVKGQYALRGVSQINGTLTGRRFEFKNKAFRPGKGWFDLAADGNSFSGAAVTNGFAGWYGWHGRKAPEFSRHAKLEAGKMVDGSTKNLLTYTVRAPEGYREGDGKKWPAIVILHGSNMNGKAYVSTMAAVWPDLARDYLLIGVNGETPSDTGDNPQFNYTYVNYVGRSTFKGFPGTDRESPALVTEALDELRDVYPISRYFVGGHSQGGFLTYSLLMNFPEKIAGAFPISAGVIFQCEPTAYADQKLMAAQHSVPLAIVHGKNDPLVDFGSGEYAAVLFGEAGWPAFRFFTDDTGAGHMFARLPVDEAIRWLESQATDDPNRLLDFAERRMKESGFRDAVAAVNRCRTLVLENTTDAKSRLDRLSRELDAKAADGAKRFLVRIRKEEQNDGKWIDDFLAYRDDFEFAPAADEVMQAFNLLRAKHDIPAKKALADANAAFQQNMPDEGFAKYQEIVDKFFAASCYRNAKRWLAERK